MSRSRHFNAILTRRSLAWAAGAGAAGLGLYLLSGRADPTKQAHADEESLANFRSVEIEGGRVLLDRSAIPTSFVEPPMLAGDVAAGRLPALRERVGLDPIVVEPLQRIGRYGGVMRRAFVGPGDSQGVARIASGPDGLLYWDFAWRRLRPNIARDFEWSADRRTLTLSLRRGMRWSDGTPFTSDDIMFWYEDMYKNPRVVAAPSATLRIDGRDVVIERIDEHTVQFVSPSPYQSLGEVLAGYTDIGGPSVGGRSGMGGYAPAHYLQRFHPKFSSEDALNAQARDAGFANWSIWMKNRNDWCLNTELPVVSPWKTLSPINTQTFTLERNPYSIWVDTAGQQLPYIDHVSHIHCSGPDAVNFKAVAGKLDYQERHLYVSKLPFLLANRQRSNYRVNLTPFEGTDLGIRVNLDYRDDPVVGALLNNTEFRRALSLGLDRDEINEAFLLGAGIASAASPAPTNKFYPGQAWARRWAEYDPDRANAMLNSLGLEARDREGYRVRPDGQGRLRLVCQAVVAHFDYPAVAEMVREQWRQIGVDLDVQVVEITLWLQRAMSNSIQIALQFTGSEDPFVYPDLLFPCTPVASGALMGIEFARWFQSNGEAGRRPPDYVVAMMEAWRRGRGAGDRERLEIGRDLIRAHIDNVLSIGLISGGMSQYGIHLSKRNLVNVPRRIINTHVLRAPGNALPMTFFFDDADGDENS
ncbi:ABC transporter substrate-binding protein [Terricaulis sp.]|uniref:ABC transporter substrate-binding protein n=1 Tax=Terricaulis sp. TaxID=2768686 RepID=UPI003784CC54